MAPIIPQESPQVDWPTIKIGDQVLVIRWTFYAQWLLSKRSVNVKEMPTLMASKDPSLVNTMVECFAAAVAENYTAAGLPAPTAEQWALAISNTRDTALWGQINQKLWEAVGKARPAAVSPTPDPAIQGAVQTQ